jgi:hypothetical protein
MSKILIESLIMTCSACPSQWEGKTDDDRNVYIRYRWGRLTVQFGIGEGGKGVNGEYVLKDELGGNLDGSLEESDLINILMDKDLITTNIFTGPDFKEDFKKFGYEPLEEPPVFIPSGSHASAKIETVLKRSDMTDSEKLEAIRKILNQGK